MILAIETSCDETAAAVVDLDFTIKSNIIYTQRIHEQYGGVVPEVASREHVVRLPQIIDEALLKASVTFADLSYIAVTYGPGLAGSLMIGVEAAKTLGYIHHIPVIPINHMAGHIYANLERRDLSFPLLALTVSGGHTEIVEMNGYEDFCILSQTHDDAVGEVYDKVARVLGLSYPGGPKVAQLAESGNVDALYPIAKLKEHPLAMSFSGLKTAITNDVHNKRQKGEAIISENIAASFQATIIETLSQKVNYFLKQKEYKQLVLSGGVSANRRIREMMENIAKQNNVYFTAPSMPLCTDNAAMIGLAAAAQIKYNSHCNQEKSENITISPNAVLK